MLRLGGALLLAFLAAVFAAENATPVAIHFFFWTARALPLVVVILASILVGAALMALAGLARLARQNQELARLRQRLTPPAGEGPRA